MSQWPYMLKFMKVPFSISESLNPDQAKSLPYCFQRTNDLLNFSLVCIFQLKPLCFYQFFFLTREAILPIYACLQDFWMTTRSFNTIIYSDGHWMYPSFGQHEPWFISSSELFKSLYSFIIPTSYWNCYPISHLN